MRASAKEKKNMTPYCERRKIYLTAFAIISLVERYFSVAN